MRLISITGHCSTARLGVGGPPGTVLGTRGATDPVTSPYAYRDHPEIWLWGTLWGAVTDCGYCRAWG